MIKKKKRQNKKCWRSIHEMIYFFVFTPFSIPVLPWVS